MALSAHPKVSSWIRWVATHLIQITRIRVLDSAIRVVSPFLPNALRRAAAQSLPNIVDGTLRAEAAHGGCGLLHLARRHSFNQESPRIRPFDSHQRRKLLS